MQRLHGHNFVLEVILEGEVTQLDAAEMLIDFDVIDLAVSDVYTHLLDHHHLNDTLHLVSGPAKTWRSPCTGSWSSGYPIW